MGGIVNTADIGYDEVIAMSGMALLQRRTLISLQDRRFEPAVIASSKRLTHALVDSRLAGRLLVNIAQFRQSATFRLSDDGAHVKYLSSLMDNSHQILVQYLDLLRANLDPAEFDRLVPSISQLMAEFGLDASFAFSIGRESLAAHIFSKPTTAPKQISQSAPDAEGDVSMGDDATATESAPDTTKPETPAPEAPGEAHVTAATSFDALNPIVESLRSTTPESAWQKISIEFFAIFWALQLGDLGVPWAPYHAQQARLQEQYRQVTKDRKLLQAQRSAKQKELKDTMDTFIKESTQQSERVAKAKVLITKRMDTWFMGEPLKPNGVSDAILGQCLLPRIILSKIDSEYSFALIKYIHELSCPNFRLMALYDRLFKANRLRGMLFTCTVQEGVYLGHFFHLILRELNKWHKSSADYEKEAIGKSKRSGGYLGFATAFDEEGHPTSHLDHAEFQDVLYGWHKNINLALKACLSGTEWTHIRNAISFLTEAHEDFPAITFMGTQLQNQLKTIVAREKNLRGDLWLTAQRVLGNMAKMEKTWIAPQAFRTNLSTQSAAQGNEDEQASSSGGSLRATAPEFRPSPWLLELSKLTGKLFKRYRELDATPILRYVHDQLLHGNSTDLIILSELVDAMGGIVNTADIGYDEVIAMSGMALLQRRTLISLQDRRFEPAVIASAKRLTHALVDSRLAGRLLVNIAQFRQSATFRLSDDGAHVKYLSSLMDNSHQILVQYLDLLRANLDPAEFDRLVPSISQLMAEFGLDASFAFSIGRESLAAHIFSKPTTAPKQISQPAPDAEGDVSMGDDATATEPAPDTTKPETPAPEAPGEAHVTAATSFDALNPIVESLRSTTPESAWQKISIEFFAIFWALQLGDLGVPWAPYHAQQARLQEQYRQVTKDRKLLQAQRSAKQKELKDTMDTFIKESTQQSERVAKAKVLITKRMDTWFMGEPLKPNGVSDAILGQCLLPRIILSKIDSEYSFALIKYIHELSCPNFRLMALYDRLFKANRLRGMLFTCTVQEGVYLGHFFHLILRELNKWHKSSADYEKEAIGKSKRSGGYLGFATAFDEEGHPTSHLDHAEFQDVLYGWHKNINLALKACLSGTEWTHIRNAISFLTEAHEDFPAVTFMGTQLQSQLKTIVAREKNLRGDLWLTAQRVLGNMAKMEKTWIAPQAFRTNLSTQSAAQANEDEQASSSGGSLRATAPEFRPS
ncbi:hypothetical protein BN1723_000808 [Verticillium longisporum]|uniref:THO complex subunitTHOC2 C-terminal domain-containing protein n=2 Tax=Verticillium longisporum TaxID=100787 RepID=A0A0G4N7Q9_VERLO|nr:hypothetical protein BN1723_000808 [Verticillium longisporum]